MDPREYLQSLGIEDVGGYGAYDLGTADAAAGAGVPTDTAEGTLAQAKVLARLAQPGATTGVQRFGAGLGAKNNKTPGNKWVAAMDGAMTGFSGAVGGHSKNALAEQTQRMNMLRTLFGMDRQLANDKATHKYREDALEVARERNRTRGTGEGHYSDPLLRDERMRKALAPYKDVLDKDDAVDPASPRKLSPDARKKAQDAYDAEKARLEGLTSVPRQSSAPNPGSPTGTAIPVPGAPAPGPAPAPAPAPGPVPAPGPAPTAPQPPARPPQMTKEQLIPAALEKLKSGTVPMDAIIAGAKEKFGVDLTPQDLGVAPTPAPAPAPDASVDPMGNPTGAAPGPQSMGPMDILKSLFA
jgi:hypothetical protein